MSDVTQADKIAVLAEWVGVDFDKSWNPFVHAHHWDHLTNQLLIRGEPWQTSWLLRLEDVLRERRSFGDSDMASGQNWCRYCLATATPAEKSEALYRAIVEQKGES